MLAGEGEKALTKAREYDAKVNIEITKIDASKDFLERVQRQIYELRGVVDNLNYPAIIGLNQLESQPFDRNRDADVRKFQKVALLLTVDS